MMIYSSIFDGFVTSYTRVKENALKYYNVKAYRCQAKRRYNSAKQSVRNFAYPGHKRRPDA